MFATKDQPIKRSLPLARAQSWVRDEQRSSVPAVKVFVTQQAFLKVSAHSRSDMQNEVGGWLAGTWCWDKDLQEEFVVVEAIIPAKAVRQGSTFITFTHDSQVEMLSVLEDRYPEKRIVGWYHTHPRMGLFLSEHDLWLHKQFFSRPWQVALVVEPHSCVGGFFVRDTENELDPHRYFGFYELLSDDAESVSHWQNLRKENVEESSIKEEAKP